jgi:hypothetical protein
MTTNIYEDLSELRKDVQVLQVALALMAQKLYPTVKIDKSFWDEVHAVVKENFEAEKNAEEEAE